MSLFQKQQLQHQLQQQQIQHQYYASTNLNNHNSNNSANANINNHNSSNHIGFGNNHSHSQSHSQGHNYNSNNYNNNIGGVGSASGSNANDIYLNGNDWKHQLSNIDLLYCSSTNDLKPLVNFLKSIANVKLEDELHSSLVNNQYHLNNQQRHIGHPHQFQMLLLETFDIDLTKLLKLLQFAASAFQRQFNQAESETQHLTLQINQLRTRTLQQLDEIERLTKERTDLYYKLEKIKYQQQYNNNTTTTTATNPNPTYHSDNNFRRNSINGYNNQFSNGVGSGIGSGMSNNNLPELDKLQDLVKSCVSQTLSESGGIANSNDNSRLGALADQINELKQQNHQQSLVVQQLQKQQANNGNDGNDGTINSDNVRAMITKQFQSYEKQLIALQTELNTVKDSILRLDPKKQEKKHYLHMRQKVEEVKGRMERLENSWSEFIASDEQYAFNGNNYANSGAETENDNDNDADIDTDDKSTASGSAKRSSPGSGSGSGGTGRRRGAGTARDEDEVEVNINEMMELNFRGSGSYEGEKGGHGLHMNQQQNHQRVGIPIRDDDDDNEQLEYSEEEHMPTIQEEIMSPLPNMSPLSIRQGQQKDMPDGGNEDDDAEEYKDVEAIRKKILEEINLDGNDYSQQNNQNGQYQVDGDEYDDEYEDNYDYENEVEVDGTRSRLIIEDLKKYLENANQKDQNYVTYGDKPYRLLSHFKHHEDTIEAEKSYIVQKLDEILEQRGIDHNGLTDDDLYAYIDQLEMEKKNDDNYLDQTEMRDHLDTATNGVIHDNINFINAMGENYRFDTASHKKSFVNKNNNQDIQDILRNVDYLHTSGSIINLNNSIIKSRIDSLNNSVGSPNIHGNGNAGGNIDGLDSSLNSSLNSSHNRRMLYFSNSNNNVNSNIIVEQQNNSESNNMNINSKKIKAIKDRLNVSSGSNSSSGSKI